MARGVTVMTDYGHHPTEIRATLRAVRECFGETLKRLVVIFQPHRYTRTKLCWQEYLTCFKDADLLLLTEIYAASEIPIEAISGELLSTAVEHTNVEFIPSLENLRQALLPRLEAGDLVICLGAGSIGAVPEGLLEALSGSQEGPSDTKIAPSLVALEAELGSLGREA